jgi:hypothetical protein
MPDLSPELEAWVLTLPEEVQFVVRLKPPTICYRSIENEGHYWLDGITENEGVVSYSVLHGSDSFLPGFRVYHVNPETLVPCGCGCYERAADSQIEAANKVVEAMLRASRKQADASPPHPGGSSA